MLRLMTEDEEKLAGKVSNISMRLNSIRNSLKQKLNREPTDSEWAQSCRLTEKSLHTYLTMSQKAKNSLVEHNLRLVDFWVRRFLENTKVAKDISYYDLMIEGIIGLTNAAENYDGRTRFAYYSSFHIRSALYQGITKLNPGSYASYRNIIINIKAIKIKEHLKSTLGRKPTDIEIASALKMKVNTYLSIKNAATNKKMISANSPCSSNCNNDDSSGESNSDIQTYLDLFLTSKQISSHYNIENQLWREDFNNILETILTPIERRTLAIRYGLISNNNNNTNKMNEPNSLYTTAELMCMSEESIRKIIIRALEKLRAAPSTMTALLEEGPPKPSITTTAGRLGARMY
jgi:RNA polymerase sigma factor (sigma-70 family)